MKKNSYLLSCLAIAVSSACHAEVLTYPDPLGSSQSDFGGRIVADAKCAHRTGR